MDKFRFKPGDSVLIVFMVLPHPVLGKIVTAINSNNPEYLVSYYNHRDERDEIRLPEKSLIINNEISKLLYL